MPVALRRADEAAHHGDPARAHERHARCAAPPRRSRPVCGSARVNCASVIITWRASTCSARQPVLPERRDDEHRRELLAERRDRVERARREVAERLERLGERRQLVEHRGQLGRRRRRTPRRRRASRARPASRCRSRSASTARSAPMSWPFAACSATCEQRVGGAAERADHHDRLAVAAAPRRCAAVRAIAVGIADGRAAELADDHALRRPARSRRAARR